MRQLISSVRLASTLTLALGTPAIAEVDGITGLHVIADGQGGFTGPLDPFDQFGIAVASLGDVNGDGISDLAVGANRDDDGGTDHGAVWILFLDEQGQAIGQQKISDTSGGFAEQLHEYAMFGRSVAAPGDLDGDGVADLAVGAVGFDNGFGLGAIWLLLLNADGTVKSEQRISTNAGGLGNTATGSDHFGWSIAPLGDLDGNGVVDVDDLIAVILGWGCTGPCAADVNGNGTVDVDDVVALILAWGAC